MYDVVIRNGDVVDGSGATARTADVAIADGTIAAVGGDIGASRREIDATGLLVTPGFVDVHTHYDAQATWDPFLTPSSWHGVTTAVVGNCGVGFAPAAPDRHDWLIEMMEGVEDIPGAALTEGIQWEWETFPEYLDALDRRNYVIDLGTQVPHGAVRAYVMGERGAANDEANADDIARHGRSRRRGSARRRAGFLDQSRRRSTSRSRVSCVPGTMVDADGTLRHRRRDDRGRPRRLPVRTRTRHPPRPGMALDA